MSRSSRNVFAGLLVIALAFSGAAMAQRKTIEITAPAEGTIVHPGQTIAVTVDSPAGVVFESIAVMGENPIGKSHTAQKLPAEFPVEIPKDISCRRYTLTAIGIIIPGRSEFSESVLIDVERPDMPVSLSLVQSSTLIMEPKNQLPILVLATFADQSILEVTESSKITYHSTKPTVATVNENGIVEAVAAGNGSIVVSYKNLDGADLQLTIPVTVQ